MSLAVSNSSYNTSSGSFIGDLWGAVKSGADWITGKAKSAEVVVSSSGVETVSIGVIKYEKSASGGYTVAGSDASAAVSSGAPTSYTDSQVFFMRNGMWLMIGGFAVIGFVFLRK